MITYNGIEANSDATVTTTDTLHGKVGTDAEMADSSLYDLLGGAILNTVDLAAHVRNFATATSTANLTDATIFTYTGSIEIMHIIGRLTTVHPGNANTCLLKITPDSLTLLNMCTATDLTGMDEGTLISLTGTVGDALVVTDAIGAMGPAQANSFVATCVTSGTIKTVFSDTGNQSGAIAWEMVWRPLSAGATVV